MRDEFANQSPRQPFATHQLMLYDLRAEISNSRTLVPPVSKELLDKAIFALMEYNVILDSMTANNTVQALQ
jgi:hypothetical protein